MYISLPSDYSRRGDRRQQLIDPKRRVVELYRAGETPEVHEDTTSVRGDGPLGGFELVMGRVWGFAPASE